MGLTTSLLVAAVIAAAGVTTPALAESAVVNAAPAKLSPADLQQVTDKYLFDTSLGRFAKLRSSKPHRDQLTWSSDTCSWSPDRPYFNDFRAPCWRHDFGYRNYKRQGRFSEENRKKIDDNFRRDMYRVCSKYTGWESVRGVHCRRVADGYHMVVRHRGR